MPCEDCVNRGRERIRSLSLNHSMLSMGSGPEVTLNRKQRASENFSSQRQRFGPKEPSVLSSQEVIRWDITRLLAVWMLESFPTFTCNLTFSPSLTSTFSRGVNMVGLAPLLCLDGSFVTGDPGAAPVVLSVTSTDSEN